MPENIEPNYPLDWRDAIILILFGFEMGVIVSILVIGVL